MMQFLVQENAPDGTVVGAIPLEVAPPGTLVRSLSDDRNNNKRPAFTIGADNLIRVTDSGELDYEKLVADPIYNFLISKDGPDELISIRVEDVLNETRIGTPGDDTLRPFGWGGSTLIGLSGNDQLTGSFLKDTLIGGSGRDILTGGLESDQFVFDTPLRDGVDRITDFVTGLRGELDQIVLDKDAFTRLKTQRFSFQSVQNTRAARGSRALFVYDAGSGDLFYNVNGRAAGFGPRGGKFAQLSQGLSLSAQSFVVQD